LELSSTPNGCLTGVCTEAMGRICKVVVVDSFVIMKIGRICYWRSREEMRMENGSFENQVENLCRLLIVGSRCLVLYVVVGAFFGCCCLNLIRYTREVFDVGRGLLSQATALPTVKDMILIRFGCADPE
jgi:hypothetical protein